MKDCPNCGKELPDYVTKCKYCDTAFELPGNENTPIDLIVKPEKKHSAIVEWANRQVERRTLSSEN